jgi:hypothetical protein
MEENHLCFKLKYEIKYKYKKKTEENPTNPHRIQKHRSKASDCSKGRERGERSKREKGNLKKEGCFDRTKRLLIKVLPVVCEI